jgi:hypothetical protein
MNEEKKINVQGKVLKGYAYWPHPTNKGVGIIRFDAADGHEQFYFVNAAVLRQLAEGSLKNAAALEKI